MVGNAFLSPCLESDAGREKAGRNSAGACQHTHEGNFICAELVGQTGKKGNRRHERRDGILFLLDAGELEQ